MKWYSHTRDFYTAMQMDELEPHESASINLRKISTVVNKFQNYV